MRYPSARVAKELFPDCWRYNVAGRKFESKRVLIFPMHLELIVQMRPGRETGSPDEADHFPLLDMLPGA